MPIYLLGSRTRSVQIANQAVSVSISGPAHGVALYATASDGQNVVKVNPQLVIVPPITGTVTIGVEPDSSVCFGHDTVVRLAIGSDSPDELDPVQVTFDPVNVSGSGAEELATLTPRGDHVEVAVRAVPDTPLSPLANMARTAARRTAGSRQWPRGGALSIGVDTSASMRWAFDDGSVAAAVDTIVGVADVVGIQDVTAALVGGRYTPVDAPVAGLAQAIAGAAVQWSAGARWSLLPDAGHTIAITDSVTRVRDGRFPALRVSHDGALAVSGPALPAPPEGTTTERHLAANPALVDQLAAALLGALT